MEQVSKKWLGLLGLARRAGKLLFVEEANMKAIRSRKAALIILAEDAAQNTKKNYYNKARFYNIPILEKGTKQILGQAIGSSNTAAIVCLDRGFSKQLQR
ncbi:MAG: hypothetical protein GX764_04715 [Firmicutes bacterium]|nr:hypothetical protein [Bacillota bacterium]